MRRQGVNANGESLSSMYVEREVTNSFGLDCSNLPSLTRQEFADECDINKLMAKFEKTGLMPSHLNNAPPRYLDVSDVPDLRNSLDMLADATAAFMSLPAVVRREFDNDPVQFVEFAQDPENLEQLRTWGLAKPVEAEPPPQRVEVVNPSPEPPKA